MRARRGSQSDGVSEANSVRATTDIRGISQGKPLMQASVPTANRLKSLGMCLFECMIIVFLYNERWCFVTFFTSIYLLALHMDRDKGLIPACLRRGIRDPRIDHSVIPVNKTAIGRSTPFFLSRGSWEGRVPV